MSPCEQYQELISRMVDGDLSAKEERELSAHIESCPSCAALYRAFSMLSGQVGEDLEDAPLDLQDNVMAEIRREEIRRKNRLPVIFRIVMSTAACVAVIVGVYLGVSLTRGAHLGVAAYKSAMDSAAKQESVLTEEAAPESAEAPALASAPSLALGGSEEQKEAPEADTFRAGMIEDALKNAGSDFGLAMESEDAGSAEAGGVLNAVPAEADAMPVPAPTAPLPPFGDDDCAEDDSPMAFWEAPGSEEGFAEEAAEAESELPEGELDGYDLSLFRALLKGKPTDMDEQELADAVFGRIQLHKGRQSWTVLLYQRDGSLYYLDPVEDTIYRSELTREEWQEILGDTLG